MIKIVSFKICPFVQRITALLQAKGIDYQTDFIDLSDKPEWFLKISPNAQVPLLITSAGDVLFESDAISEYLDDVFVPLHPDLTAERRAFERAWIYQATKHYLVQCGTMRSPDEQTFFTRVQKLESVFAKVENVLTSAPYFSGTSIGNVDIAWLVLLHRSFIVFEHTGYDFLADYPKLRRWRSHLMLTDIVKKSVPGDFEVLFESFYLSSQTFLGRTEAGKISKANTDTKSVSAGVGRSCC